jgi:hypothetical protein
MGDRTDAQIVADEARHLIHIARDLRSAGDVPLVRLDEDGVGPDPCTLAGELELIALRLDWDAVMSMPPPPGGESV